MVMLSDLAQDKEDQVCDDGSDGILEQIRGTEMPGREEDLHGFFEKAEGNSCDQSDPRLPAHGFEKEDECDAYDKVFDQVNVAAELQGGSLVSEFDEHPAEGLAQLICLPGTLEHQENDGEDHQSQQEACSNLCFHSSSSVGLFRSRSCNHK